MSRTPRAQDDDAEREDDRVADAMKTQLRKDVASWSKARGELSSGRIAEPEAPVAKKPSSRLTTAAREDQRTDDTRRQTGGHEFQAVQYVVRRQDDGRIHPGHDRPRRPVNWVTFEVAGGGLVSVQLQHIVAIYDEQGTVKLATTASGVHVLKDITVQRAVMAVCAAADAEATRSG